MLRRHRQKNTAGLLVAAGFQAIAALAGKAQNRHIISGVIGQFRLVIAQHQAGYRKNLRVALSGFQQLFQPVRFGKGIVIEQGHILAFGHGDALVDSMGKTGILAVFDQVVAGLPQ